MKNVISLHVKKVFAALETSSNGLNSEEARKRLAKYGPNALVEKKSIPVAYKFLAHLKDLFSILLLFASLLSALGGMWQLSLTILMVVLVNTLFSLFQEWRAEKAVEILKNWMPEYAKVIRDGELQKTLVKELVPGDVIILEEGDRVPADARLIEAFDLWTNNVPLTGESEPQPRSDKPTKFTNGSYLDSPNLVFMSTSVAKGQGKAVVYATGMNTKFGEIANLTQEIREEQSPLQKEIANTAKYDFALAVAVGCVFFLASLVWLHLDFYSSILFMIGVMVACVPEGLQVTVSSALAINVLKMVKENALVKRLSAVQTLGSVTVICTDKTGTITRGEMTVRKILVNRRVIDVSGAGYAPIGEFTSNSKVLEKRDVENVEKLLEISALCNSSKVEPPSDKNKSWSVIGDPTDGALLVAALKYGLNMQALLTQKPIIHIAPFDSKRKRMTTIHKDSDELFAYTKGAPRSILSICDRIVVDNKIEDLAGEHLRSIETSIREFANKGLRVIAVAYKEMPKNGAFKGKNVEKNMILVGLAAMKDPPRPEVKEAVKKAKQAGIKIVIITGDYGPTAQAIAEEVGIVDQSSCRIIRGVDLETMNDEAIVDEVKSENVIFARVSPEQKLRIVKVLKKSGEVVAVTGDGANDAPSLREADIGVAMGASGTDVAREASDMVLLDDSFASIVKAVESGRTIYENIRKFIVYVFSHNWGELIPYVLYALLGIPLPLLVVQVLAIDLAIDVIPSLALSREPPEPGIMQEPPRSVKERIFNAKVFFRSLYIGAIIAAGAMFGCLSAWSAGGWRWGMQLPSNSIVYLKGVTMTFAGIVIAQVGNVLACRTSMVSIFKTSLSSNKWIWIGIVAQVSIISFLVYVPLMQRLFGTTALGLSDWALLAVFAVIVIFAEEVRKWFARRREHQVLISIPTIYGLMSGKEFFVSRYEKLGWKPKEVKPRQAIRINVTNTKKANIIKRLVMLGIELEKIPFLENGYWICRSKFSVGATSEYLLGLYSIQEAAAQIPATLFTELKNKTVLDACAAPGGKTVQLADLMQNTGAIIALDVRRQRLTAMSNQLERCHVKNVIVYDLDARQASRLNVKFDRILLDVPCSGNFVTDKDWFGRRTIRDVERNAKLQREILAEVAKVLKDDGEIVYSTCSLEPEENELNMDWAMKSLELQVEKINCYGEKALKKVFGKQFHSSLEKCRRIWPEKTQGFFVCKLKKSEDAP